MQRVARQRPALPRPRARHNGGSATLVRPAALCSPSPDQAWPLSARARRQRCWLGWPLGQRRSQRSVALAARARVAQRRGLAAGRTRASETYQRAHTVVPTPATCRVKSALQSPQVRAQGQGFVLGRCQPQSGASSASIASLHAPSSSCPPTTAAVRHARRQSVATPPPATAPPPDRPRAYGVVRASQSACRVLHQQPPTSSPLACSFDSRPPVGCRRRRAWVRQRRRS